MGKSLFEYGAVHGYPGKKGKKDLAEKPDRLLPVSLKRKM
jgi:hypothetical protein